MNGHCERVAALAVRIAEALGICDRDVETVRLGALLHDTVIGDDVFEPPAPLESVRPIVRHHHERWDGNGSPDGLSRERIPAGARILAVAESIHAMSAHRIYRAPLTQPQIVRELEQGRGAQWDPTVVDVALEMIDSGELSFAADGLRIDFRPPVRPVRAAAVIDFPTPHAAGTQEIAG